MTIESATVKSDPVASAAIATYLTQPAEPLAESHASAGTVVQQGPYSINLEIRSLRSKEIDTDFKFLVVRQAKDWLPVDAYPVPYTLRRPNSNSVLRFNLRPISLHEWENAESELPFPDIDLEDSNVSEEEREKYRLDKELVKAKRKAYFLEKSIGLKIPGNSLEEKIAWLSKRGKGEIDALYDYTTEDLSGFSEGHLVGLYQNISAASQTAAEVTEITDLSRWEEASNIEIVFRCQRPGLDYITEFPLRNLSEDDKRRIDGENKQPTPPKLPARTKDNRFDPSRMVEDFNDYNYRQRMRAYSRKKMVMIVEAALLFELPGTTVEEKYDWLGQRPIGEICKLRDFIQSEILSYKKHYQSFI